MSAIASIIALFSLQFHPFFPVSKQDFVLTDGENFIFYVVEKYVLWEVFYLVKGKNVRFVAYKTVFSTWKEREKDLWDEGVKADTIGCKRNIMPLPLHLLDAGSRGSALQNMGAKEKFLGVEGREMGFIGLVTRAQMCEKEKKKKPFCKFQGLQNGIIFEKIAQKSQVGEFTPPYSYITDYQCITN